MRPISLLPALSKAFEDAIHLQISSHLLDNELLSNRQSGFRPKHNTTSVIAELTNYIHDNFERNKFTALVLLDFSKAFNSVSIELLCKKLLLKFQFSPNACRLIHSYLTNRFQCVLMEDEVSDTLVLGSGVPQGSILGPLLFSMHIDDITEVIKHCKFHLYADDVQIYLSDTFHNRNSCIRLLNTDLNAIFEWSVANQLKLNPLKSQAIIFRKPLLLTDFPNISINNSVVNLSDKVKNLGLILKFNLNWDSQINSICSRVFFIIKQLQPFYKSTPLATRVLLIRALVIPHLFYGDITFSKLNEELLRRLKVAFNSCI